MSKSRAFLVVCLAAATSAAAAAPEPLALTNANVVSVRDGRVHSGVTIVLRDSRIESIGSGPAPAGVRALDLRGRYVLPGLIDAHTHVSNFAAGRLALESGVTTLRSSGVSYYFDVGFRELVKQGALPGPDMLASGYHVRPRVADEAFVSEPSLFDLMKGVDSADKLRRMVRANLGHGVDWIKVLASERAGTADTDPRKQVYSETELQAVVDEAASKGVPVQAHAHGEEGALAAVRAGVRSIEHGTYLSEAALQLMKQKGTYLVPTYTTVVDLTEPGGDYDVPALRIRGGHMLPRLRRTVQRAQQLGVKIVTGGDTGYGASSVTRVSQEIANFVEMGMAPLEALRCATWIAAELLQREKSIGSLEKGFEADLLAVEANPFENVRTLHDPLLVISNGRVALNRLDVAKTP